LPNKVYMPTNVFYLVGIYTFICQFIKVNFIKAKLINSFYKYVFKIVKYLR